jgi:hypothetical protein
MKTNMHWARRHKATSIRTTSPLASTTTRHPSMRAAMAPTRATSVHATSRWHPQRTGIRPCERQWHPQGPPTSSQPAPCHYISDNRPSHKTSTRSTATVGIGASRNVVARGRWDGTRGPCGCHCWSAERMRNPCACHRDCRTDVGLSSLPLGWSCARTDARPSRVPSTHPMGCTTLIDAIGLLARTDSEPSTPSAHPTTRRHDGPPRWGLGASRHVVARGRGDDVGGPCGCHCLSRQRMSGPSSVPQLLARTDSEPSTPSAHPTKRRHARPRRWGLGAPRHVVARGRWDDVGGPCGCHRDHLDDTGPLWVP